MFSSPMVLARGMGGSFENPPYKRGKEGEAFRGLSRWVRES